MDAKEPMTAMLIPTQRTSKSVFSKILESWIYRQIYKLCKKKYIEYLLTL
jgi:hypothetical protein